MACYQRTESRKRLYPKCLDRATEWCLAGRWLIIEFVPKGDSQVERLLATREDIFPDYTQEDFEKAFTEEFEIATCTSIEGSARTLYLLHGKS